MNDEQQAWLADSLEKAKTTGEINPCVQAYGRGPVGVRCKHCLMDCDAEFIDGQWFDLTHLKLAQVEGDLR